MKSFIEKYQPIFDTPEKNLFRDDITKLEDTIDINDAKRSKSGIFYPSVSRIVSLDKYKSDFRWFWSGLNPL